MPIIFQAKTREGYIFKILAELLHHNIQTACFEIDKDGIKLQMMDHERLILIDLILNAEKFTMYKYNQTNKMYLGINMRHFYQMLKPIKKKDSIHLVIDSENLEDLVINVIPKENNRLTSSTIKIQTIQNIDIDIPSDYDNSIIISSGEFQKMCKGLATISNITRVVSKGCMIKFSNDDGGVMKRCTEFGEIENKDDDEDNDEYDENFDSKQLIRVTKLAGLSQNMRIYTKKDAPLLIKSDIGILGYISVYLKSESMREADSIMESEYNNE